MNKKLVRQITDNAFIAAIYYLLTLIIGDWAFLGIQLRIAEMLIFLVYFRKDFLIGLTVGCFLANLHSPMMPWDLLFGTLATFISALLVSYSRKMFMGIIYPSIINGIVIGVMLFYILEAPFFESIVFVFIGEVVVLTFGYFLFRLLTKDDRFMELIMSERGNGNEEKSN